MFKRLFRKKEIENKEITNNDNEDINKNIKEIHTNNITENINNKKFNCVKFVKQVKEIIEDENINFIKEVKNTNESIIHIGKESENKVINNEDDLYNFYLSVKSEDNRIPNKVKTSELTGLHFEKIKRLNKRLKDDNKLENKGKELFIKVGDN